MNHVNLIVSADGSHTIAVPSLNEHYHSIHGAVSESMHVYIKNGLWKTEKSVINILEIGFGTGLNALLTAVHANNKQINYTALEKYPLPLSIWNQLNYGAIAAPQNDQLFEKIHQSNWNSPQQITPQFTLTKIEGDFTTLPLIGNYDIVYYDAFGPDKQPELWDPSLFVKLYAAMSPNAILVTYCAKGSVRRALKAAGLKPDRIPGPPPKREMLFAKKIV